MKGSACARLCKQIGIRVWETQLKMGNMQNEARPPGHWHIPDTSFSKKRERLQPFSSVVMKTAAVLCISWRSTVHSVISPSEKYYKTNAYTVGPFDQYLRGALCCFPPRYMRFSQNIQKQETIALKTAQFLVEKKQDPKLRNVVDENSQ